MHVTRQKLKRYVAEEERALQGKRKMKGEGDRAREDERVKANEWHTPWRNEGECFIIIKTMWNEIQRHDWRTSGRAGSS